MKKGIIIDLEQYRQQQEAVKEEPIAVSEELEKAIELLIQKLKQSSADT